MERFRRFLTRILHIFGVFARYTGRFSFHADKKREKDPSPTLKAIPALCTWRNAVFSPPEETREFVVIERDPHFGDFLNIRLFNHAYPGHHSPEWRAGFWPTPSLALERREVIFWLDGLVRPGG